MYHLIRHSCFALPLLLHHRIQQYHSLQSPIPFYICCQLLSPNRECSQSMAKAMYDASPNSFQYENTQMHYTVLNQNHLRYLSTMLHSLPYRNHLSICTLNLDSIPIDILILKDCWSNTLLLNLVYLRRYQWIDLYNATHYILTILQTHHRFASSRLVCSASSCNLEGNHSFDSINSSHYPTYIYRSHFLCRISIIEMIYINQLT